MKKQRRIIAKYCIPTTQALLLSFANINDIFEDNSGLPKPKKMQAEYQRRMEAEVKAMRIDEITHQIAKLDMGKEIEENTSMVIKQRAI
jgi:hypothetical protein